MKTDRSERYKGIIFDLDGTLVDTVADLTDSLNEVLREHDLPLASYEDGKRWIGNGLRKLIIRALPEELKEDDAFIDQAVIKMKEYYHDRWINKTRPYPGAPELLRYCNQNDIPVAISSNKPNDASNYIITNLFPDIDFKRIQGNVEGMPHKPDPTQTDSVVKELGLDPSEILYVGDSVTDYQTALNSHLTPVLVDYGYGDQAKMDELGVLRIKNLLDLVDKL